MVSLYILSGVEWLSCIVLQVLEADSVDEVEVSSETISRAPLFGTEEAGDTVSTSPILYFQC